MPDKKSRFFTKSELKQMGVETVELIQQAVDAGKQEDTKKLARRMYREAYFLHESYRDWITSLLSYIYRHNGDKAVYEALHEAFEQLSIIMDTYRSVDAGRRAEMLAAGFRGHLTSVVVEEDDDKFTVMMPLCGSAGRSLSNKGYEKPTNFAKIKKPQILTFGKRDFPVFCAHCAMEEIVAMEKTGYPVWVIDIPEKVGTGPCKYHIYKDPEKIPSKYYERYGFKKPTAKRSK
jgi:hypothetical protein